MSGPEKAIQADILKELRRLGCYAADMSQPRRSMMPLGLPDIYWRHEGWGVHGWIEVKAPTGRLTTHQRAWHEGERAAGGNVAVAYSVGDALRAVEDAKRRRAA